MLLNMEAVTVETMAQEKADGLHTTDYILNEKTPFAVNEAYKALRTNVIFSLPDEGAKVIGITSSGQGEGKSTVALNLAVSFGQVGKKVLLIDCDLRLPPIAEKLGITGAPGLSDLLVGGESAIRFMKEIGIYVLSSGTLPPDATTLLSSARMNELMTEVRGQFDYIFFDLPPATTVSDSIILSKYTDGFLLVIRHKYAKHRAISDLLQQLTITDTNILGYIYTNAEVSNGYYKRYGKQYGSHHETNRRMSFKKVREALAQAKQRFANREKHVQ